MSSIAGIVSLLWPRTFATTVLRETLVLHGLDDAMFPINELADWSITMSRLEARIKQGPPSAYLRKTTAVIASTAVAVAAGASDWSASKIRRGVDRGSADYIWEIMAAHDPERFGLDGLETTQTANAGLLRAAQQIRVGDVQGPLQA